jgi:hypothetical protein
MRGLLAGKSVRLTTAALLALLACSLVAPSDAKAGCSSHVAHWSGHEPLAHFLDPLVAGRSVRSQDESTPATTPDHPRPCSGPSCSGKSTPPAVPALSEVRYVELWACLGRTVMLPELDSGLVTASSSGLNPALAAPEIFHPPRLVAHPSRV